MHNSFRDGFEKEAGFEKCALLWSAGKDPSKFRALAQGLVKQRAKNEGVSLVEAYNPIGKFKTKMLSLVIKKPPQAVRQQLDEAFSSRGSHAIIDKKLAVVPPKSPLGAQHTGSDSSKEAITPIVTHHELDELQQAGQHGMTPTKLKWQRNVMAIKDMIKRGPMKAAIDRQMHGAPLGYKGFHSHLTPDVILRESNRVFHEAAPEASQTMKAFREFSREAPTLKRHGLRYGEEYIPEGGRRWNKLVKKLEGTMPVNTPTRKDISAFSEKFKSGDAPTVKGIFKENT
jgi:hypothetical protein